MKKVIATLSVAAFAASVFAQGAMDFGNNFTGVFRAPIYGPGADATAAVTGQSSLGVPAGATVYGGSLLSGAGYTLALFAGAAGSTEAQLSLITSQPFRTGANAAALPNGLVLGGTVNIPGVAAGSTAVFQIRVWDNKGGTLGTWAAAEAAWLGGNTAAGKTGLITSGPLGGIGPTGPVSNPATVGWTSFNIYAVPEPSSFALAGIGAAAMLIFRRRK